MELPAHDISSFRLITAPHHTIPQHTHVCNMQKELRYMIHRTTHSLTHTGTEQERTGTRTERSSDRWHHASNHTHDNWLSPAFFAKNKGRRDSRGRELSLVDYGRYDAIESLVSRNYQRVVSNLTPAPIPPHPPLGAPSWMPYWVSAWLPGSQLRRS